MIKDLRSYQSDAIDYIGESIANGTKSMVAALPTGAGKTVIFSHMANRAVANGYLVLIVTDSTKLLSQISAYFSTPYIISAKTKKGAILPTAGVIVSMAQTLIRRKYLLEQLNSCQRLICIVDEAHIKTSCSPLSHLPNCIKIGFTATPVGKHLKEYFESIYNAVSVQELLDQNYLTECQSWIRKVVDTTTLHKTGGDYNESEQLEAFKTGLSGLVEDLSKKDYRKALVFTSSIAQCDQVAAYLNSQGLITSTVHSEQDELPTFLSDVDICVSVGMLTKGFDFSAIDLIILYRATASLPLFLQMCGRGSRLHDGKEHFRLIDYGGNIARHGLWEADREWSLSDPDKKRKSDETIINGLGICECENCGYVSLEKFTECPKCLHVAETPAPELSETVLVRYDNKDLFSLSATALYDYAIATNSKRKCIGIAKRKGLEYLTDYAKAAGYNNKWVDITYNNLYRKHG